MSFNHTAWAWQTPLKHPAKLVLLALANRADKETGECFPALPTIADDLGWSKHSVKTVRRGIAELHDLGYIEVSAQFQGKGQQTSNLFKLHLGYIHKPLPEGRADIPTGADSPTSVDERAVHSARVHSPRRAESTHVGADNPTNQSSNSSSSSTTEEVTRTRENDDLDALEAQMIEETSGDPAPDGVDPDFDWYAHLGGWSA